MIKLQPNENGQHLFNAPGRVIPAPTVSVSSTTRPSGLFHVASPQPTSSTGTWNIHAPFSPIAHTLTFGFQFSCGTKV